MEKEARSRYTGLEIIFYNLERLNLNVQNFWEFKNMQTDVKTLGERRKIIEKEKQEILEKRDKRLKEIMTFRKSNYFLMLKRGLLHIIYIILYIETFKLQIPLKEVRFFLINFIILKIILELFHKS